MRKIVGTTPLKERLTRKLIIQEDGCMVWTGYILPNGYASISLGRRGSGRDYVHRVAYRLKHGDIPDGMMIDHLCRNRACANPEHLEAVTNRENTYRGKLPKLNIEKASKLRDMYVSGEHTRAELAEIFSISLSNVNRVVNNRHWVVGI